MKYDSLLSVLYLSPSNDNVNMFHHEVNKYLVYTLIMFLNNFYIARELDPSFLSLLLLFCCFLDKRNSLDPSFFSLIFNKFLIERILKNLI